MFDVTFLEPNTTQEQLRKYVINRVVANPQFVSSICVYLGNIPYVKASLLHFPQVKMGTVLNFPQGRMDIHQLRSQTKQAITAGAEEFDLVVPWFKLDTNDFNSVHDQVSFVRDLIGNKTLKVIVESGELHPAYLYDISYLCLCAGADFIKTSTGKTKIGATIEAVTTICEALNQYYCDYNIVKGIKVSGGIKSLKDVELYKNTIRNSLMRMWFWGLKIRFGVGPSSIALEEFSNEYN